MKRMLLMLCVLCLLLTGCRKVPAEESTGAPSTEPVSAETLPVQTPGTEETVGQSEPAEITEAPETEPEDTEPAPTTEPDREEKPGAGKPQGTEPAKEDEKATEPSEEATEPSEEPTDEFIPGENETPMG